MKKEGIIRVGNFYFVTELITFQKGRETNTRTRNKINNSLSHLQTIQRGMPPRPKEKQGNKQETFGSSSNKSCLKPNGGQSQLLVQSLEVPQEMLPQSVYWK